jgi:hypothetical protein
MRVDWLQRTRKRAAALRENTFEKLIGIPSGGFKVFGQFDSGGGL